MNTSASTSDQAYWEQWEDVAGCGVDNGYFNPAGAVMELGEKIEIPDLEQLIQSMHCCDTESYGSSDQDSEFWRGETEVTHAIWSTIKNHCDQTKTFAFALINRNKFHQAVLVTQPYMLIPFLQQVRGKFCDLVGFYAVELETANKGLRRDFVAL